MEESVNEKRINHWVNQAAEDYKTAKIMFLTRRWKYSIFMCQQSIEKFLKALFMKKKGEFPPRIHNLFRLAEKIDKEIFPGSYLEFFSELSMYYIQSRYPDDIDRIEEINKKSRAKEILKKTEEVIKWIKNTKS